MLVQKAYFISIDSQRSAIRWGANLIAQLWNITYQLWCNRNDILHKTDCINQLSGLPLLRQSITSEHGLGLLDLPQEYRRYFSMPLLVILSKRPAFLKRWFLVIRSGREALHPDHHYTDEWSTDAALRRWIGLTPRGSH